MIRVSGRAITSLVAVAIVAGCGGAGTLTTRTEPTVRPTAAALVDPEPTPEDAGGGLIDPAPVTPKSFKTPSKRGWAQVVKAPDKHTGKGFKVWTCIVQFDAATGDDVFRGFASYKRQDYWVVDGANAMFSGTTKQLSDFVAGDIVSMNVAVIGSYSYDTQAGGNTTVPAFRVVTIKRQKGSCS